MPRIVVFDYSTSPGGSLSRMLELAEQLNDLQFIFFTYHPIKDLHKGNISLTIETYHIHSFFNYSKKYALQEHANKTFGRLGQNLAKKILAMVDAFSNVYEVTQALFWIRFRKVDIVQANLGFHKFPYLIAKSIKKPFVIYFRTLDPWVAGNADAINTASKLIFVAQRLRLEYENLLNIPPQKAVVIHSPNHAQTRMDSLRHYDTSIIEQLSNKGTTIIVAARIAKQKGQIIATKAIAMLAQKIPNLYLILVGTINPDEESQRYYDELVEFVRDNNLEKNIILLGHRADALHLIKQANIALHPALLFEPMSGAVIESMQLGTPTIAAAIGGQADLIRHGENGFLFPPGNHEKLAEIIQDIVQKNIDVNKVIKAGQIDALAFSDPYRIQSEMRTLYNNIISTTSK